MERGLGSPDTSSAAWCNSSASRLRMNQWLSFTSTRVAPAASAPSTPALWDRSGTRGPPRRFPPCRRRCRRASGQSYLAPLLCITKYLTTGRRPHIVCVMVAPRPLHDRALDNLRFIRQTMERAGSFTAVPGWGQVAVGITALAAAFLAARQRTPELWLATWLGAAIVALAIGGSTLVWQAYAVNDPLLSGPGRRAGSNFLPPMVVGGPLTVALSRAGLWPALPGTWL